MNKIQENRTIGTISYKLKSISTQRSFFLHTALLSVSYSSTIKLLTVWLIVPQFDFEGESRMGGGCLLQRCGEKVADACAQLSAQWHSITLQVCLLLTVETGSAGGGWGVGGSAFPPLVLEGAQTQWVTCPAPDQREQVCQVYQARRLVCVQSVRTHTHPHTSS